MANKVRITIEYDGRMETSECDLLLAVFMKEHPAGFDSVQSIVGTSDIMGLVSAIRHLRRLETMLKEKVAIPEPILEAVISSLPETTVTESKAGNAAKKNYTGDEALIMNCLLKILGELDSGK